MGNHLACISIHSCDVVAAKHMSNLIVVVHSGESRVLELSGPSVQVAELMLEFPGFCITELVYSNSQHSTNRAVPMSADKELMAFNIKKPCVAYVLLPMNMMQKTVSAQEWASWTQMVIKHLSLNPVVKQQSKSRSGRASNRIAPLDVQDAAVEDIGTINVEEQQDEAEQSPEAHNIIELLKEELSSISSSYSRRYWAPKLETIIEV